MKRKIFSFCLSILTVNAFAQSSSFDEKAKVYVQKYASWAIEEQQRVGIPAAITLAQGIYETGAGESELATQANNHFGIKCKKEWRGETFAHTDDAPNECFRKYKSAKESYIDHSNYLKNSLRYAELFTFDATNYTAWAKGLKKCGYATNPAYAQKLIKMVEDYELQQYTLSALRQNEVIPIKEEAKNESETPSNNKLISSNESSESVDQTPSTKQDGIVLINNLKAVFCKKGEMLLEKAIGNNIRYARLLEINELNDEPLQRDMFVFLEPKAARGHMQPISFQKLKQ